MNMKLTRLHMELKKICGNFNVQKDMGLGLLCKEGVHCCRLGTRTHFLSCHIVMHRSTSNGEVFFVDDYYVLKKE